VDETIESSQYHAQDQKTATVLSDIPEISSLSFSVDDNGMSITLTAHIDNADACALSAPAAPGVLVPLELRNGIASAQIWPADKCTALRVFVDGVERGPLIKADNLFNPLQLEVVATRGRTVVNQTLNLTPLPPAPLLKAEPLVYRTQDDLGRFHCSATWDCVGATDAESPPLGAFSYDPTTTQWGVRWFAETADSQPLCQHTFEHGVDFDLTLWGWSVVTAPFSPAI
jgi:hypothetical protein